MEASTSTSLSPVTTSPKEQTEAGNYFVANYPPFSFWTQEQAPMIPEILERPAPVDLPLGLYFHIPFCRKRCHFCYFRVYTDKNANEIRAYLEAAAVEMDRYANSPYLQGRKPQFVYFGGGTPSYLSVEQLRELTDRMKSYLPWDEAEEVAFEAEPGTLTEKKLEAIRDIGVTRLSLGIEAFDDHILEVNGRAHRSKEAFRAIEFAKTLGFQQLNIDLIAGMMDETEDNWKRCVETAIAQEPDCVTIYQMEIPYNTTIYKEMQASGKVTAPVANWPTKRAWVNYAFEQFEKAGYTVNSTCTVVKNPATTKFVYRDSLWSGSDLLALGVASFGHLAGVHYQNHADIGPYMMMVDEGRLPIYRAYQTNAEERLIREFVLRLKLGQVSISHYQEKYGVDVTERFAGHLGHLKSEGFLTIEGDTIKLNRDGLLQVDWLLHGFFLEKHRSARYT
ncbi:MAG: coproporphyrinogen-III oxidase family protein [Verrucomicrobiales bacterium]|nr:coproporphyrinogen III oxidase family protein [Verrucomicrobiae bacterium]MCP5556074.1 coproporphyrinogen III oxidase family protein [Akkermansiaceae bacterium]